MFKIKDLMLKIIPEEAERPDLGQAGWCGFCTGMDSCGTCTFCTATCSGFFTHARPDLNDRVNPWDLTALKAQLRLRTEQVEAAEERLAPQSLEEAEVLEKKLREALDEVKRLKAEFSKGDTGRAP